MDALYAAIGRKQIELDALHAEYYRLLALLDEVATGAIVPSRVTVNRTSRTWAIAPLQPDDVGPLPLATESSLSI